MYYGFDCFLQLLKSKEQTQYQNRDFFFLFRLGLCSMYSVILADSQTAVCIFKSKYRMFLLRYNDQFCKHCLNDILPYYGSSCQHLCKLGVVSAFPL